MPQVDPPLSARAASSLSEASTQSESSVCKMFTSNRIPSNWMNACCSFSVPSPVSLHSCASPKTRTVFGRRGLQQRSELAQCNYCCMLVPSPRKLEQPVDEPGVRRGLAGLRVAP